MNILITGDLTSMAFSIAKRIARDGEKVVLTDENLEQSKVKNVVYYPISADSDLFSEVIPAYKFDAVVFLATREEQIYNHSGRNPGRILDGLLNTLKICKAENVKHLFYISSTEIFGEKSNSSEDTTPQPASPNGFVLQAGERQCRYYSDYYGVGTTIIRVPYIYGDDEKRTFLYKTVEACRTNKEVMLPGNEDSACGFIHVDDIANLFPRMLDEIDHLESETYNLSPAVSTTYGELAELLNQYFPNVSFQFDHTNPHLTIPVLTEKVRKQFDWTASHDLKVDLLGEVQKICTEPKVKISPLLRVTKKTGPLRGYLKWLELVLGAAITQFLVDFTYTPVQFRYLDFRLLFVILMGVTHGTEFGLLAAILAGASVIISMNRIDVDWTVIFYTVEYWLPFGLYLAAGVITGYLHDRKDNQIKFENENTQLIQEKYRFLYNVYDEIRRLKDQFHDQLIGSRDSFGRIFNITKELDTLQEEEILLKALNVLETVMENQNIAIYSIAPDGYYARLELCSPGLVGQITKSLKLSDYPSILAKVKQGEIFQNTTLESGYPDYFASIKNGDLTVAAVAIWQASFEQKTLYYFNLFKVICGLVQSSIVRATIFENANADRIFVPSTRILQPEAFKKILKTKLEMKKNKTSDFQLVRIDGISGKDQSSLVDLYTLLSKKIRTMDVLGLLDDQHSYLVLSQVDQGSISDILNRLKGSGVNCEIVNESELAYV